MADKLDGPLQLVKTKCIHTITDKAGTHQCPEDAISPTYPYCYKHLRTTNSPAQRFKRYGDSMSTIIRDKYEQQLQDQRPSDLEAELANLRGLINVWNEKIRMTVTPEGTVVISEKDLAVIEKLTDQVRKLVETQAKVNPEGYVSLKDMKEIIRDMIEIVAASLPDSMMDVRQHVVNNIQKYCMEKLSSRALLGTEIDSK